MSANNKETPEKMFHVYLVKQNAVTQKPEQHGFYFVADSVEKAREEFLAYSRKFLGEEQEPEAVQVEEIFEDAQVTRTPGRVTISCS